MVMGEFLYHGCWMMALSILVSLGFWIMALSILDRKSYSGFFFEVTISD